MTWLVTLGEKIGGKFVGFGALIAALLAFWWRARQDGKDLMQAEQDRHRAEAIAAKRKSDSEIDDLGHADLDQRFDRWLRH
jgi:hypothetical protein